MTTLYSNTTFQANTKIFYSDNVAITIDYSGYFERIATGIENLTANVASLAANVATINTTLSNVAGNVASQVTVLNSVAANVSVQTTALNGVAGNVHAIEVLGSGAGFRTNTPAGILGLATTYRYLVMNGMAANTVNVVNTEVQQVAMNNIAYEANAAIAFLNTLPFLGY